MPIFLFLLRPEFLIFPCILIFFSIRFIILRSIIIVSFVCLLFVYYDYLQILYNYYHNFVITQKSGFISTVRSLDNFIRIPVLATLNTMGTYLTDASFKLNSYNNYLEYNYEYKNNYFCPNNLVLCSGIVLGNVLFILGLIKIILCKKRISTLSCKLFIAMLSCIILLCIIGQFTIDTGKSSSFFYFLHTYILIKAKNLIHLVPFLFLIISFFYIFIIFIY